MKHFLQGLKHMLGATNIFQALANGLMLSGAFASASHPTDPTVAEVSNLMLTASKALTAIDAAKQTGNHDTARVALNVIKSSVDDVIATLPPQTANPAPLASISNIITQ